MDLKTWAEHLDQMPMYPYFTLSHAIVCTINVRSDLGTGALYFSRKHPLACWISSLLCIFSSTILANFLLNEPVISALGNTQQVLWASAIWYLVFYSPFDIAYRLLSFMPIKMIVHCMGEIHNCKSIYQGIQHAAKIFPDSYAVIICIGLVKGNGPGFIKMLENLVRGAWSVNALEFMHPSYSTKISAFATLVFVANRFIEQLMITQSFVFFCVVSACIYFRLSVILLDLNDPFAPLENLSCLLLFGGIWDALARAIALDEQSQHSHSQHSNHLRARAMKVDMLSRGRLVVEKVPILTPQSAT